ncbi:HDOD domain-containing protein [Craterilacuibacter sp. RT1T]|uniref:EAL and HDOD domain-containing protein n=1 Tax=Craterilacuibacter sp. RT1T TaxID=2942211 RepID=UPI0020BEB214|nr:HDOD domain-containing protein [Craterilacuibacter sp. RT1T]MCL6262199.1 HDOD domain-containing protein [Craterilacuibacter sp. RT1T]
MLKSLFASLRAKPAIAEPVAAIAETALPPTLGVLTHQPVYDARHNLVANEFLLSQAMRAGPAPNKEPGQFDRLMLRTLINLDVFGSLSRRASVIHLSSLASLSAPELADLPAEHIILLLDIAPDEVLTMDSTEQLAILKTQGYRLALAAASLSPQHTATQSQTLLSQADFLVVDFSASAEGVLAPLLNHTLQQHPHIAAYARNVSSYEDYNVCRHSRNHHFTLFQGPFMAHSRQQNPEQANPGQIRVMEIMRLLRSDAPVRELDAQFKLDSTLLFKLLRFINASANGITRKIMTLDETLLLLGREALFKWLTLLLFSSHKDDGRSRALLEQSLSRARFMESLGKARGGNKIENEHLFLTGMFSMLGALLKQPLEQAIAPLELPTTVVQALLEGRGLFAPYLVLAQAMENHSSQEIRRLSHALGIPLEQVNSLSMQAMQWAENISCTDASH